MTETHSIVERIHALETEFRTEYSRKRAELEPMFHRQVLHQVDALSTMTRQQLFYLVVTWGIPVSEKRKALGWSHQTYTKHLSWDVNKEIPDISSRLGLKYRRDPHSPEARTYLHRINDLQRQLRVPEWDSLPPAPVKKWTRRKPTPAKNENG